MEEREREVDVWSGEKGEGKRGDENKGEKERSGHGGQSSNVEIYKLKM